MVNCIFGRFIKGLDKHLVQVPEIAREALHTIYIYYKTMYIEG